MFTLVELVQIQYRLIIKCCYVGGKPTCEFGNRYGRWNVRSEALQECERWWSWRGEAPKAGSRTGLGGYRVSKKEGAVICDHGICRWLPSALDLYSDSHGSGYSQFKASQFKASQFKFTISYGPSVNRWPAILYTFRIYLLRPSFLSGRLLGGYFYNWVVRSDQSISVEW